MVRKTIADAFALYLERASAVTSRYLAETAAIPLKNHNAGGVSPHSGYDPLEPRPRPLLTPSQSNPVSRAEIPGISGRLTRCLPPRHPVSRAATPGISN